ncbi:hypothetical protein EYC98_07145 [Halieaceae bacterium IMCC14734]|uniref:Nucleoside-diphosphate sugar epimerase n=1 Tax=Candidatus Litorirhabdus singularis TaxID=2518993 RepID=A0ABT3TEB3_9GAMM|nr:ELM1/GtrOC1 family putative glycosyltransferase [Candidatus Litorirhabdus singularis]MCX2980651.1 hypothetical protein [Candidatus Litorirhabdus singularis]
MSNSEKETPIVWLVIGDKGGDNAQIAMISNTLGIPVVTKTVLPKAKFVLGKPFFRPSVKHLDLDRSDPLTAPWPDLILTIGRRPAMAALWIQKQSTKNTKIVLLGRPKRFLKRFSLIIAASHYQVPEDPRIITLNLPLFTVNKHDIATQGQAWKTRFEALPRPTVALMVGGKTDPFRFDADTAKDLMQSMKTQFDSATVYISTSRRTSPAVTDIIKQELPANWQLFAWGDDSTNNPYRALLSEADYFVVTGDSVSMLVEVAQMGKPLAIYALPNQTSIIARLKLAATGHGKFSAIIKPIFGVLQKLGLVGYTRDLTRIHSYLYQQKLAVPLGKEFVPSPGYKDSDALEHVSRRIKQLLET